MERRALAEELKELRASGVPAREAAVLCGVGLINAQLTYHPGRYRKTAEWRAAANDLDALVRKVGLSQAAKLLGVDYCYLSRIRRRLGFPPAKSNIETAFYAGSVRAEELAWLSTWRAHWLAQVLAAAHVRTWEEHQLHLALLRVGKHPARPAWTGIDKVGLGRVLRAGSEHWTVDNGVWALTVPGVPPADVADSRDVELYAAALERTWKHSPPTTSSAPSPI